MRTKKTTGRIWFTKKRLTAAVKETAAVTALLFLAVVPGAAAGASAAAVTTYASDKAVETVYLGEPKYVWWETDTVGKWSSVKGAHEYQVKLYRADSVDRDEDNWRAADFEDEGMEAVMTKRTSETSCDFTEYMSDLHTYFFVVRATPKVSEQAYVVSGSWVASPDMDFKEKQTIGITTGKWRNYLTGSRYETEDGTYLSGGWHLIRGSWYLFDEGGFRLTGWQTDDGKRYYLGENGQMATGWFVWEGNWYYAGKDGAMQTGWVMDKPGKYYYLYEDGSMAHDTVVDGYTLDSTGLCKQ